jgi:Tol biopolymer transport system component
VIAACVTGVAGAAPGPPALIAFTAVAGTGSAIVLFDAEGRKVANLSLPGEHDCCASWSPDGSHVVFSGTRDPRLAAAIYTMSADGADVRRLTSPESEDARPAWSPDGSGIAWLRRSFSGPYALWLMNADGSGQRSLGAAALDTPQWSPNGRLLTWTSVDRGEIPVYDVAAGSVHRVDIGGMTGNQPRWSPDASQIAFIGDGSLFVVPARGGRVRRLSQISGRDPQWSTDGRELVFTGVRIIPGTYGRMGPAFRSDVFAAWADGSGERRLTGPLDEGFTMPAGGGDGPVFWPDGSRLFFLSGRGSPERYATYVMNADGSCEQRFALSSLLLVGPAWQPGASPALPPLSCVDLRVTAELPKLIGIQRDEILSVTLENDGNQAATGLRVEVKAQGPAHLTPYSDVRCTPEAGLLCELPPLAAGRQTGFTIRLVAARPGIEKVTVRVSAVEADPDRTAESATVIAGVEPCTYLGTELDDTMFGTPQADKMCGEGGRDRIDGAAGNDYIDGGTSADRIDGGKGRDLLIGGGGPDTIVAWDGERDVIGCGPGTDVVLADGVDRVAPDCEKVARR